MLWGSEMSLRQLGVNHLGLNCPGVNCYGIEMSAAQCNYLAYILSQVTIYFVNPQDDGAGRMINHNPVYVRCKSGLFKAAFLRVWTISLSALPLILNAKKILDSDPDEKLRLLSCPVKTHFLRESAADHHCRQSNKNKRWG